MNFRSVPAAQNGSEMKTLQAYRTFEKFDARSRCIEKCDCAGSLVPETSRKYYRRHYLLAAASRKMSAMQPPNRDLLSIGHNSLYDPSLLDLYIYVCMYVRWRSRKNHYTIGKLARCRAKYCDTASRELTYPRCIEPIFGIMYRILAVVINSRHVR